MIPTPVSRWGKIRHMMPIIHLWHEHQHQSEQQNGEPSSGHEKALPPMPDQNAAEGSTSSRHSLRVVGEKLKDLFNESNTSLSSASSNPSKGKSKVHVEARKDSSWNIKRTFGDFIHRNKSPKERKKIHHVNLEKDPLVEDKLKIFVGTWNMFGQLPPSNLAPFVDEPSDDDAPGPYLRKDNTHPYHLIVIATQECERDIKEAVFFPSKEEWEDRLESYLGENYTRLRSETMAALNIQVFVWSKVSYMAKEDHGTYIATGFANMIGNKGAVAISVLFGDSSFLFVNSHLTANQDKVAERNDNFHRICHDLKIKPFKAHPRHYHEDKLAENVTNRYDHVFWCGDMNYRVEADKADAEIAISSGNYKHLLEKDQLTKQLLKEPIFKGFYEAPIRFPPTYKFDTSDAIMSAPVTPTEQEDEEAKGLNLPRSNSDTQLAVPEVNIPELQVSPEGFTKLPLGLIYDTSPKQRVPSWTDRILYKSTDDNGDPHLPHDADGHKIECWRYQAMFNVVGVSDHRPVIGVFAVDYDWSRYLQEHKESLKRRANAL